MHNLPFMLLPNLTPRYLLRLALPSYPIRWLPSTPTKYRVQLFARFCTSCGVTWRPAATEQSRAAQRLTSSLAMVMGMEKVVERQVERGVARATVSGIVQTVVNCGLANSNSNSNSGSHSDSVWWHRLRYQVLVLGGNSCPLYMTFDIYG